jgi:uncharacterized protein (TIGR00297 family)
MAYYLPELALGLALNGLIAWVAYRKNSLSLSGFYTAIFVGTGMFYAGAWMSNQIIWISLMLFFVTSSLLTKYRANEKEKYTKSHDKGGRRDYAQVLANGLLPLLFAVITAFTGSFFTLVAGVSTIATSTADTWASEIGILSRGKTISILTWKPIPQGESGGVSMLGIFASILGAGFISLFFAVYMNGIGELTIVQSGLSLLIIATGGLLGSMIDSVLGITIQARYQGLISGIVTEKKKLASEATKLISGWAIMTNDMVNFVSSFSAAILIAFATSFI